MDPACFQLSNSYRFRVIVIDFPDIIPIIEDHVPNEFVVRGHVVVGDHAAKPPGPELHSDVSSDEVMRATGLARARKRRVGRGWARSKVSGRV